MAAVIVPALLMPPNTAALLVTKMPLPEVPEVMLPALTMAPPTVALVMVMPVRVGAVAPVAVMRPPVELLVTLPVTVRLLLTTMQVAGPVLVIVACDPGPLNVSQPAA
ncbi:MAG: hypothetical protein WAK35_10555 [Xanthobacteraceae bacterium]